MNGIWPGTLTAEALEHLSDEEFWSYAHELALQTPTDPSPQEYLRCELNSGSSLIPLTALYEVVPPPHHFALLPAIPDWMPGVVACHGETIAVVDLAAYLSTNTPVNDPGGDKSSSEATLLIAKHSGLPIGLLVSAIGPTTTMQSEASILNVPAILTNIVQQIRDACPP